MKFLCERDINKLNAMEYVKQHFPSCVITSCVISKTGDTQLLGIEIFKYLQIFDWRCKIRTLNWGFCDCST